MGLTWSIPGSVQFSSVTQSCPTLCDPMNRTCQASLSITNSQNLLKLMSIELVMPSNYLILCHPLLLLPPIPPSIRFFSNESNLHMRWPKYWSFSFSISPSNEHPRSMSQFKRVSQRSPDIQTRVSKQAGATRSFGQLPFCFYGYQSASNRHGLKGTCWHTTGLYRQHLS